MADVALMLPGFEPPAQRPVARSTDPVEALHELFGFAGFRPGQQEAVEAALGGRDVLVVMPTGSGKSLCYQLPALMRTDLTVVVSPLVSLMQDQVEAVKRIAPGRVAQLNAQQDTVSNRRALDAAVRGDLRLLYVAPERFSSPGFVERLRGARVGLFVVDEAHCVSQWGHDFRPDYFRLAAAARALGAEAVVASTATATPQVAADVAERLGLRDPVRVGTGFDRPNLTFAVVPSATKEAAHRGIVAALAEPDARPAIVYAGTRAEAERLAGRLARELEVAVRPYHAGLPREVRADAQRRFMAGSVPVIVATNAFGMGVDKPDVRTVCHESVPGSLEAYYQEAGRAGRDGRPARCLLFAGARDKGLHVFFIERSTVDDDRIAAVARRVVDAGPDYDVALADLGDEDGARAVVGLLVQAGVVQPVPAPPDRVAGRVAGAWDAAARAACREVAVAATKARWRQYRAVWEWVEGGACRRAGLLGHFGDEGIPAPRDGVPCCDVCDPAARPAPPPAGSRGAARPRLIARRLTAGAEDTLDAAILDLVERAEPGLGRTRAVEVLRGGRSKAVVQHAYDGLPQYGTFGHLGADAVLERIDALLAAGTLRTSAGRYPKLEVA